MNVPQYLISVVICTYNRCECLATTLDSLLKQKISSTFDYEVIVVDNNSKDQTKEVVESFKYKFCKRLQYIFEPKQGLSFARNRGIREANGEIVAFTDDDCIVDKFWLENINKVFKTKEIDLVGGKVIPSFFEDPPKWLRNYEDKNLRYPLIYYNLGDSYLDNSKNNIYPLGANIALRKNSLKKFGHFSYLGRAEDVELSNRWQKLGAKVAYAPDIIVYHYGATERLTKKIFRKWFFRTGVDNTDLFRYKFQAGINLLGVPLWLYKLFLLRILFFLRHILVFNKGIFSEELGIWYDCGMILNLYKIKLGIKNSDDLYIKEEA